MVANSHRLNGKITEVAWGEHDPKLVVDFLDLLAKNQTSLRHRRLLGDEEALKSFLGDLELLSSGGQRQALFTVAGILLFCRQYPPGLHVEVHLTRKLYGIRPPPYAMPILELRKQLVEQILQASRSSSPDQRDERGGEKAIDLYPPEVVREAVTNLLIHRDYLRVEPARIVLHADHIEFVNAAGDNPVLRRVFADLGYARNQKTGLAQMRRALEEYRSFGPDGRVGLKEETGAVYRLTIRAYGTVPSLKGGRSDQLNYKKGLKQLRALLRQQELPYLNEFYVLEARLLENLEAKRVYGPTEAASSSRARIIAALNDLTARAGLTLDFNDLCRGIESTVAQAVSDAMVAAIETVPVPAGDFWMGSDRNDREAHENEKPQHRVTLPAYEIGKYPVTNARYWVFVRATGHPTPAHWSDGQVPSDKENHPVVNVSLDDARAFCRWLTKTTGQLYRLPTEAEWEKAARGACPDRRRYPWGDEWMDGAVNTKEAGYDDTTPVDAFAEKNRSPLRVVDMVGNVQEWTNSQYKPYPGSTHETMVSGTRYVVRGGCYTLPRDCARVSWRGRYTPDTVRPYLGFRVAVEVESGEA